MGRRSFRKTRSTRVQAVLTLGILLVLLGDLGWSGGASPVAVGVLTALALVALVYLVLAFGDRFDLQDDAVHYRNVWLGRLGLGRERALDLSQIASLREHRGRTLFIKDRSGKRFVIDAVTDYVELRDHILYAYQASQGNDSTDPP